MPRQPSRWPKRESRADALRDRARDRIVVRRGEGSARCAVPGRAGSDGVEDGLGEHARRWTRRAARRGSSSGAGVTASRSRPVAEGPARRHARLAGPRGRSAGERFARHGPLTPVDRRRPLNTGPTPPAPELPDRPRLPIDPHQRPLGRRHDVAVELRQQLHAREDEELPSADSAGWSSSSGVLTPAGTLSWTPVAALTSRISKPLPVTYVLVGGDQARRGGGDRRQEERGRDGRSCQQ